MARPHSVEERSAIAAAVITTRGIRVEVEDEDGTWRDWTDRCIAWSVGEDRDQPVSAATFAFHRGKTTGSLAPLMTTSLLNRDSLSAYAPAIDIGRHVRLFTTSGPDGEQEVWVGRINAVDPAGGVLQVTASDLGAWLLDTQIDATRTYGSDTGVLLETILQEILDDNAPGAVATPTLYVPVSPAYYRTTFDLEPTTKVLEAVRQLALNIGWDVRYRYDAAGVSRLTLFEPDRERVDTDWSTGPSEYKPIQRLAANIDAIRTTGEVQWVDADGVVQRATYDNLAARTRYGRRWFSIPPQTGIDTEEEAQTLVDAAGHDMSGPGAEFAVEMGYLWFLQLYDRGEFLPDLRSFDETQTLSVVSYRHSWSAGESITTSITATSRIVGAYAEWRQRIRGSVAVTEPTDADVYNITSERVSDTQALLTWSRGSSIAKVTVHTWTLPVGSPFPDPDVTVPDTTDILDTGTDELLVAVPEAGQRTFVQLEGRNTRLGIVGDVERLYLDPDPQLLSWTATATEPTAGTGRLTIVLVDGGGYVDAAQRVRFRITQNGITTEAAATTGPGAGTSGTYTKDVTLDPKHPTLVEAFVTYTDASTETLERATFDLDKQANLRLDTVTQGNTARVTVNGDTDTATGVGMGRYAIDAESGWTTFDIAADRTAVLTVALTGAAQVVYVQAQNLEGAWGPSASTELQPVPVALSTRLKLTSTQGIITWGGTNVEVAIDDGAFGAPPADDDAGTTGNQITVARNAAGGATKHYHFRANVNGQVFAHTESIPPQLSTDYLVLRLNSISIHSEAADELEANATITGPANHIHVMWRQAGSTGAYTEGAEGLIFVVGPPYNVDSGGGSTRTIEAYIAAHDSSHTVIGTSNERTFTFPAGSDF